MIELALDPDLEMRWLIRVGTRVDDVWHNSLLPYVADLQGRGWRGHGVAMETRKCCSECCSRMLRRPRSRARATASVRRWTWSLPKIRRLWPFTVSRARNSRAPIS